MEKRVNVYAGAPVVAIKYPITGTVRSILLSTDEIRKCIFAKAKVEEILPNGRTVRLDFTNYDKVNTEANSNSMVKNTPIQKTVFPEEAIKAAQEAEAAKKAAEVEEAKAATEEKAEEAPVEEVAEVEEAKAATEEKAEEAPVEEVAEVEEAEETSEEAEVVEENNGGKKNKKNKKNR